MLHNWYVAYELDWYEKSVHAEYFEGPYVATAREVLDEQRLGRFGNLPDKVCRRSSYERGSVLSKDVRRGR